MNVLRSYAYLFGRYRRQYAIGVAALFATNAFYMAIPRVLGAVVDALEAGTTRNVIISFAAIIVGLAVAQAGARVVSRVFVLGASRRVEYDLKRMLHDRLLLLSPSFYDALSTGDLMSRMTNDVMLVRALGGPGILYSANALLIYVLGVTFMVTMSWRLTLVVLVPLPLMAWIVRGMVHRMRAYALASRKALSDLNTVVQENLAGAAVVRSFALEHAQQRRFEERSEKYVDWALKESLTRAQMIPLVALTGGLSSIGVLALGANMVAAGAVSLGDLVAFISYVAMMVFPTVAFGWILSLLQRGAAALERLDEVMQAPLTITSGSREPEPSSRPGADVTVDALTFRYSDALENYKQLLPADEPIGGRRPALVEVSIEARAGELVALVGRVGSGKSTLMKALIRLVEVSTGSVRLDGVDVVDLPLDELRARIAYVPQDDFLFAASVRDNIAFGVPGASELEVSTAAVAAGLDPDESGLAEGLDTEVGERGSNLSGGQRQRVALARALLRDSPVLVLDNALSNVDTETERRILARLAEDDVQRTLIVASNRITAVQAADRIYVLEQGRVVDRGAHAELVERPGLYSVMFEQQQLSARLDRY